MSEEQAIAMLGALSQQTRMQIVRYLVSCADAGASAGEIGAAVGAVSSRASFHLAALEKAGLLSSERVSRQIIYRANLRQLGALVSYILNDCCAGHPDVLSCCQAAGSSCGDAT